MQPGEPRRGFARLMRTWNKRLRAILVLLLVVAAGILFLKSQFARRQGCEVAKHYLPRLLGAEVRFDRCEVDLLAQTASLTHLSVYQFGDQAPTFSAESVKVRINALRPFFGSTQLDFVKVERPQVLLDLRTKTLAGHPRAAASRDCSLRFLKEVQVDQLELGDGQVRVQWDGHQIDLNGLGIEWKTEKKRAQFRIKSTGGSASMGEGREMGISALARKGTRTCRTRRSTFSGRSLPWRTPAWFSTAPSRSCAIRSFRYRAKQCSQSRQRRSYSG